MIFIPYRSPIIRIFANAKFRILKAKTVLIRGPENREHQLAKLRLRQWGKLGAGGGMTSEVS